MKKLILSLVLLLAMVSASYAQDTVTFAPALEGSVLYDTNAGTLVPVLGLQFVSAFDGLLEMRAMVIGDPKSLSELDKLGIGLGVNLVNLTQRLGQTWTAKIINPTVGIAPIYSMGGKAWNVGVYATIIRIKL